MDEYGIIHFPSTTNNDIWMSTNELIELFGIMYPTLKAKIKAIYKNGILDECEVQRCFNLFNGCLCTPDDYCSILSTEYIGSIQNKRIHY